MSRADRFDRADFPSPSPALQPEVPSQVVKSSSVEGRARALIWPVAVVSRVGDALLADRDGNGTPHLGLDIFAPMGTVVLAAADGSVLRVGDGRNSADKNRKRAGLWIDVLGTDSRVYRYLHLGSASVSKRDRVVAGQPIGTVAAAYTSGTGKGPHLHFEVRVSDWSRGEYGRALDPTTLLPPRRA